MRVHDEVRADALLREGHVLLLDNGPNHALLPVARRELVPKFWPPRMSHNYLDDLAAFVVLGHDHAIHVARDLVLEVERLLQVRDFLLRIALHPPACPTDSPTPS